jgi:hypothetical protein
MPIELSDIRGNIIHVKASGTLTHDDYEGLVPQMESRMERFGRLRMLFEMSEDFHGWDTGSVWDELRFEFAHAKNMKRVAVVGDRKWEKWASRLSHFFTGADVEYFDHARVEDARAWLEESWYGSG